MNSTVKGIILVIIVLVIAFLVYKFAFSKMKKGYAKNSGDWVACNITDYDKDYYQGKNTSGIDIFIKKSDVKLREGKDKSLGQCADAVKNMNVYTLKGA